MLVRLSSSSLLARQTRVVPLNTRVHRISAKSFHTGVFLREDGDWDPEGNDTPSSGSSGRRPQTPWTNDAPASEDRKFMADIAQNARSKCGLGAKCPNPRIEKGSLRIGNKYATFHAGVYRPKWFHPDCILKKFINAKKLENIIQEPDDVDGWENLEEEHQAVIVELIEKTFEERAAKEEKRLARQSKKKKKAVEAE